MPPINDRKLPRQQARGSKMPIFKSKTRNVRTISQQKKRLQSVEVHISRAVSVLVWALKQKDICLVYIVLLCMCQMRSILMRRKKPAAIRNIRWYLLGTSEHILGWKPHGPKGQLISKGIFGVYNISQKTNETKSTWGIIVVKSNLFVRFLGELRIRKSPFEINWPLPKLSTIRPRATRRQATWALQMQDF